MVKLGLTMMCLLLAAIDVSGQVTLRGRVTDRATGEPLPGATIFLPDLKTGASADIGGSFEISDLPQSVLLVSASFIGYEASSTLIDLSRHDTLDFQLQESAIEMHEIVIIGNAVTSENSRTSITITPVGRMQLLTSPATNLVNAISAVTGMSAITNGNAISKPVIRGLSYNRVVTVQEGIRQEGNQWGDEHGIEIDQFSADRIEILKGPASLFYGSDAMGGVINILEPVPPPKGTVQGELASHLSVNSMLTASSLKLEGNHNGYIWRLRGTYKDASAFRTADEYIYNSAFEEADASALAGINKKWGFSHLHLNFFDTKIGIIEGERDSAGAFVNSEGLPVTGKALKSRNEELPFQDVRHYKAAWVSNFIFSGNRLRLSLGYQGNDRREFEDSPADPALFMHLNTITYDAQYGRLFNDSIEFVTGLSGMSQQNYNRGEEYLIPDYGIQDLGIFVFLKKSWEKVTLNGGLRFDLRSVTGEGLIADTGSVSGISPDTVFTGFSSDYSAWTGSAGLTWAPAEPFSIKFNIGRGFRSPNIAELASNGVHPGTERYELGDPALQAETSLQIDGEIGFDLSYLGIVLNGYYNLIDNYIYSSNLNDETILVDGVTYPLYRFVQGNSVVAGFEAEIDFHPWRWLHFDNSIDYVHGQNLSSGEPLPMIPAMHTVHTLRINLPEGKNKRLNKPYVEVGGEYYFRQDRTDPFESTSPGYFLLNASVGCQLRVGNQLWTLFADGSNLTNKLYADHLNTLREQGIRNMGWNLTFGVVIPFGIRSL